VSRENLETLLEKWTEDAAFRRALRADPEAAVRGAGLTLDEEGWQALRGVDWNLSDEELSARASKITSCCLCCMP
jgi:predicted ribosomally synthesized peptide with nif11-like leader